MNIILSALVCTALLVGADLATAKAGVGKPAPAFTATSTSGKLVSLADYQGRFVVLEWTNPECPFVQKHYNSGNMPATQKRAMKSGTVWLTINTSDESPRLAGDKLQSWMKSKHGSSTAVLLDNGTIGQAYGARTTPHMYIVNPRGVLVYAGAIDSEPTSDPADIQRATNYVNQALDQARANKPVTQPITEPYGCAVKYPGKNASRGGCGG